MKRVPIKSDGVTQESPPEGNTTRPNFETSPPGFETGLGSKKALGVCEKVGHANDRKIMPATILTTARRYTIALDTLALAIATRS
jgi:hypothetical protein